MKPYYEEAGVQIFLGDCREVLPLEIDHDEIDLLLTDPPYGINYSHGVGGGKLARSTIFDHHSIHGDDEPFDPAPWLKFPNVILWGANHYASRLPDSAFWLVWDKRDGVCSNDQADCEIAWVKGRGNARVFRHLWNGMLKASERGEPRVHPTQKPVQLMTWCLSLIPEAKTVLDPYCGTGATLIAAKDLGRRAIGIEISEKYCEIAAKRLGQSVMQFGAAK